MDIYSRITKFLYMQSLPEASLETLQQAEKSPACAAEAAIIMAAFEARDILRGLNFNTETLQ